MSKCPECKKKIDHLHNVCSIWKRYNIDLDSKGHLNYSAHDEWDGSNTDENGYDCPECGMTLFKDENDALVFLTS